jgi:hypothetical protein
MAMQAETKIGDLDVQVSKLPAMRALKLAARIAKVLGPALASGGKPDSAAQALFDRLDADELEKIVREILTSTLIGGRPVNDLFDVLFADRLQDIVSLVTFVFNFQFSSFFEALVAAAPSVASKPAASA